MLVKTMDVKVSSSSSSSFVVVVFYLANLATAITTASASSSSPLPSLLASPSTAFPTEPTYIVGEWSSCIGPLCGAEGFRTRSVECKIFLEFSRTIATLPDVECGESRKPHGKEVCIVVENCSNTASSTASSSSSSTTNLAAISPTPTTASENNSRNKSPTPPDANVASGVNSIRWPLSKKKAKTETGVDTLLPFPDNINNTGDYDPDADTDVDTINTGYEWKEDGFTQCTASCLGGTQESLTHCIKKSDKSVVSPYLCNLEEKPDSITRTCNDHPCPPRWRVAKYTSCSKRCGGGIQTREVQCIHEVARGAENTVEVSFDKCPGSVPKRKRHCNVFDCEPRWITDPWTPCSASCGEGVMTRHVKCIKESATGVESVVNPSLCKSSPPPVTKKTCIEIECPPMPSVPSVIGNPDDPAGLIQNEDRLYVQEAPLKHLSLKIGGKAVVFEGTSLKIRCPRRKLLPGERKLASKGLKVDWLKDDRRITHSSKIDLTSKRQALRIHHVSFTDSGVYTCVVNGTSRASLILSVKSLDDSDIKTQKKGKTPQSSSDINDTVDLDGEVLQPTKQFVSDERIVEGESGSGGVNDNDTLRQQMLLQHHASSSTNNGSRTSSSTNNSFNFNFSDLIFSPPDHLFQNFVIGLSGVGAAASSASRQTKPPGISDLRGFLSNLRNSFSSTGYSPYYPTSRDSQSFNYYDFLGSGRRTKSLLETDAFLDGMGSKELLSLLGKGSSSDVNLSWIISDWSACSQTCGSPGIQVRGVQCIVKLGSVTKSVDEHLCFDHGLTKPESIRDCHIPCLSWSPREWNECHSCLTNGHGIQTRQLTCLSVDGSHVDDFLCPEKDRPPTKQPCPRPACQAVWVTGSWSECPAECDKSGIQSRMIQCLWNGTVEEAPDSECQLHHGMRPSPTRLCYGGACNNDVNDDEDSCKDQAHWCTQAKQLRMCQYDYYNKRCCNSCRSEGLTSTTSTTRQPTPKTPQLENDDGDE